MKVKPHKKNEIVVWVSVNDYEYACAMKYYGKTFKVEEPIPREEKYLYWYPFTIDDTITVYFDERIVSVDVNGEEVYCA